MLIDLASKSVSALITSEGRLLGRTTKVIPAAENDAWGEDIILTTGPEIFVGQDGTCVGFLGDVLINTDGQVVGYALDKVNVQPR